MIESKNPQIARHRYPIARPVGSQPTEWLGFGFGFWVLGFGFWVLGFWFWGGWAEMIFAVKR
jgi:hypothetical protein